MSGCRTWTLVFFLILLVPGMGCVTLDGKTAAETPVTETAPDRDALAAVFFERGTALEDQGESIEALRQYRIALTVKEDYVEALERARELESALIHQAEEHYRAGLAFHEQGKYGDARRRFLVALRCYSDHEKAADMLVSRKRIRSSRYVVHTVLPGESLSHLAARYYGDHRLFPEIARYNNLQDATRIMAGEELKIPEIEGVPFVPSNVQVQVEEKISPDSGLWDWGEMESSAILPAEGDSAEEEGEWIDECRSRGIELYRENKDRQAVEVLTRILEVRPEDGVARDYAFKAQFRLGETLLTKKEYLAARDAFLASLRFKGDCMQCHENIRKSEDLYKEVHYRNGMLYFNQEKLREAIREWEVVQRMDPNYKRVEYLIEKALKIQAKVLDLKKDQ